MGVDAQSHRPGPLAQPNKVHKTGRHRSKGAIDTAQKGKVSVQTLSKKNRQLIRKDQRRNQANQVRKNKRADVVAKKRGLGGTNTAPFLCCLLPLTMDVDPNSAIAILENCDPDAIVERSVSGVTYITIPRFKQRFSFIVPPLGRGNEFAVLDCLKVCDTTILLITAQTDEPEMLDNWGKRILNMATAQGIPTPILSLMDLESIPPKKRVQTKATIQKVMSKMLPSERPMTLDTNSDALNLLRRIGGQKRNTLHNRANRSHLFGELVEYVPDTAAEGMGTLKVTGYSRGLDFDVNGLVHIPGLGDFQMSQIDKADDPHKIEKERDAMAAEVLTAEERILCKSNPAVQTSLVRENEPDPMDAEQTWPTEAEIAESKNETKKMRLIKRVPKGMSDYQACWIPDVEEVSASDEEKEDDDDDDDDEDKLDGDDEFMSCESNENSDAENLDEKNDGDEDFDTVTVSEAPVNDEKYDQQMDLLEEEATLQKIKEARSDQQWPDERDTPLDQAARVRFQKYRGLESFRTSPWDVKENLPSEYARIFQFKNFDRMKRRVIKEMHADSGEDMFGWYITIYVSNVSAELWASYQSAQSCKQLVVYQMLAHEQKMSVMNVVLQRAPGSTIPIKAKEKMIIQCGYRRFIVNPIFSQHTNGDKHKCERYFRENSTVVATFFAPIQFPPARVLCFRENPDTSLSLCASGNMLSSNPDRVILKRIALSGHPMKINRKSATIRYMFFNKEDVDYFQPVKLRTKCGRLGHIKESLGTHGHMKCYFDGQLKSFDTVYLNLYKRVFPKWTYEDFVLSCAGAGAGDNNKMQH